MAKGGLAAGTAPNRIGADRNGAPVEEIDVGELYKVYDPVGLQNKWSIGEVAPRADCPFLSRSRARSMSPSVRAMGTRNQ